MIRLSRWTGSWFLTIVVVGQLACGDLGLEPLELPEGCNPLLAGTDCMLPFPSDVFLVEDSSLPSGRRVELNGAAALSTDLGDSANIFEGNRFDGFSRTPPILTLLNAPISAEGLVNILDEGERTLTTEHPTLLMEASTGSLVPHFVDLDPNATVPERAALIIRPLTGLKERTRYIVALHKIRSKKGGVIQAPEGFRRIRDGETKGERQLHKLAEHYDKSIFPVLQTKGIKRRELQLAWDFTTASNASVHADMLDMRRLVLDELDVTLPSVEIHSVEEDESNSAIWRVVRGVITGPSVINSNRPGADLTRDKDGRVKLSGQTQFPFTAQIPRSVATSFEPGSVLQFGHGFFGRRSEAQGAPVRSVAFESKSIVFAIDWWGMSEEDIGVLAEDLAGGLDNPLRFSHRLYQAMANWLTLSEAIRSVLINFPCFRRPSSNDSYGVLTKVGASGDSNANRVVYDSEEQNYLGISQGALLGGTYTALNPLISRSVLHVGGAALGQLMFRADPFRPFLFLLEMSLSDPLKLQKFVATVQSLADRFDPASYASYLVDESLPSIGRTSKRERQVLLQTALGDTHVPNFSSFLHARMANIPLVEPTPLEIFGLEKRMSPYVGSGLAIFDMGVDTSFSLKAQLPGPVNSVHTRLRTEARAINQMSYFLRQGLIRVD